MRISEPIETRWIFWLPDDPDNKVPATFRFLKKGRLGLKLWVYSTNCWAQSKTVLVEFDRVLGEVEDGGKVTLEKCLYQPSRLSLSGGLVGVYNTRAPGVHWSPFR